jgi:tetratricopeptide (TPR) repeat protein
MQDALFFFFGILAIWLLLRFRSASSLFLVAACLTLSLLCKETGILFVAMALYLVCRDRARLYRFIGIMVVPISVYLALKVNATGLNTNPSNAPIDAIDLGGRLLTVPSIVLFYITKLVWPLQLASAYYWVHPTFSVQYFVLPLLIDLAVVALIVYVGFAIRKRGTEAQRRTYWFFVAWTALGLLAHLQIIPLDMTVSEPWMYFPIAGVLGMIGIAVSTLAKSVRIDRRILIAMSLALLMLFGLRTALRGTDWSSAYTLAQHDIVVSPEDYSAELSISIHLATQGDIGGAIQHVSNAIRVYPTFSEYDDLGVDLIAVGKYPQAKDALVTALSYQQTYYAYDSLGALTLWYGDPNANKVFLLSALEKYPQDGKLWLYLAVQDQRNHDNAGAKVAIYNAYTYGAGDQNLYTEIMNNVPISLPSHPTMVTAGQ